MSENRSHFTLYGKSPLLQLVITILIIVTVGMALLIALTIGGILFSGLDIRSLPDNFLSEIGEGNVNLLRYLVVTEELALFIVPALIVRKLLLPESQASLKDFGLPRINEIAIVVVLAFCILPVTGITGHFNAEMKLPDWLSGVEQWMKTKENNASGLIDQLIFSETFGIMILNLIIIAVLPAISEELIFRGVFQRIFYGFFKSYHPAIWLTAFLFSAVHLQFYGFIPRFILGLVFGYLFYWSRTLWLPMIAHFVNNAAFVIASYYQGRELTGATPDISLWKQLIGLPVPVTIIVVVLLYFRNKSKRELALKIEILPVIDQDHS
jgi:membrane protease YdiL (CAAX protease family)